MLVVVLADGRLGDRRRAVQFLVGAGVRLSARGAPPRRATCCGRWAPPGCSRCTTTAATATSATSARSCATPERTLPRVDRAVDRHRRRALRRDEHGDPGDDPVAGGAADADDRVAVHRADVRRSGARPDRGDGDDVADPVRHRLVAVRGDPRLLAHPVRRRARRPVLPRLRPAAPDQALSARLAADDRRRDAAVLLLHARPAGELADPGADPAAVRLAVRRGDPAAALPPGHRQAVPDVALSRCRRWSRWRCGSTSFCPPRSPASRSRSAFLAVAVGAFALFSVDFDV